MPFSSPNALYGLSKLSVWWLRLGINIERIKPGHPEQNGAHERMHRTLKDETARPPAGNRGAQQRRFNRFRRIYNEERPHEALGQHPPATCWDRSARPLPARTPEPEYSPYALKRRVSETGAFGMQGHQIYLSSALKGQWIALEEVDNEVWSVHFYQALLGRYHERNHELHCL